MKNSRVAKILRQGVLLAAICLFALSNIIFGLFAQNPLEPNLKSDLTGNDVSVMETGRSKGDVTYDLTSTANSGTVARALNGTTVDTVLNEGEVDNQLFIAFHGRYFWEVMPSADILGMMFQYEKMNAAKTALEKQYFKFYARINGSTTGILRYSDPVTEGDEAEWFTLTLNFTVRGNNKLNVKDKSAIGVDDLEARQLKGQEVTDPSGNTYFEYSIDATKIARSPIGNTAKLKILSVSASYPGAVDASPYSAQDMGIVNLNGKNFGINNVNMLPSTGVYNRGDSTLSNLAAFATVTDNYAAFGLEVLIVDSVTGWLSFVYCYIGEGNSYTQLIPTSVDQRYATNSMAAMTTYQGFTETAFVAGSLAPVTASYRPGNNNLNFKNYYGSISNMFEPDDTNAYPKLNSDDNKILINDGRSAEFTAAGGAAGKSFVTTMSYMSGNQVIDQPLRYGCSDSTHTQTSLTYGVQHISDLTSCQAIPLSTTGFVICADYYTDQTHHNYIMPASIVTSTGGKLAHRSPDSTDTPYVCSTGIKQETSYTLSAGGTGYVWRCTHNFFTILLTTGTPSTISHNRGGSSCYFTTTLPATYKFEQVNVSTVPFYLTSDTNYASNYPQVTSPDFQSFDSNNEREFSVSKFGSIDPMSDARIEIESIHSYDRAYVSCALIKGKDAGGVFDTSLNKLKVQPIKDTEAGSSMYIVVTLKTTVNIGGSYHEFRKLASIRYSVNANLVGVAENAISYTMQTPIKTADTENERTLEKDVFRGSVLNFVCKKNAPGSIASDGDSDSISFAHVPYNSALIAGGSTELNPNTKINVSSGLLFDDAAGETDAVARKNFLVRYGDLAGTGNPDYNTVDIIVIGYFPVTTTFYLKVDDSENNSTYIPITIKVTNKLPNFDNGFTRTIKIAPATHVQGTTFSKSTLTISTAITTTNIDPDYNHGTKVEQMYKNIASDDDNIALYKLYTDNIITYQDYLNIRDNIVFSNIMSVNNSDYFDIKLLPGRDGYVFTGLKSTGKDASGNEVTRPVTVEISDGIDVYPGITLSVKVENTPVVYNPNMDNSFKNFNAATGNSVTFKGLGSGYGSSDSLGVDFDKSPISVTRVIYNYTGITTEYTTPGQTVGGASTMTYAAMANDWYIGSNGYVTQQITNGVLKLTGNSKTIPHTYTQGTETKTYSDSSYHFQILIGIIDDESGELIIPIKVKVTNRAPTVLPTHDTAELSAKNPFAINYVATSPNENYIIVTPEDLISDYDFRTIIGKNPDNTDRFFTNEVLSFTAFSYHNYTSAFEGLVSLEFYATKEAALTAARAGNTVGRITNIGSGGATAVVIRISRWTPTAPTFSFTVTDSGNYYFNSADGKYMFGENSLSSKDAYITVKRNNTGPQYLSGTIGTATNPIDLKLALKDANIPSTIYITPYAIATDLDLPADLKTPSDYKPADAYLGITNKGEFSTGLGTYTGTLLGNKGYGDVNDTFLSKYPSPYTTDLLYFDSTNPVFENNVASYVSCSRDYLNKYTLFKLTAVFSNYNNPDIRMRINVVDQSGQTLTIYFRINVYNSTPTPVNPNGTEKTPTVLKVISDENAATSIDYNARQLATDIDTNLEFKDADRLIFDKNTIVNVSPTPNSIHYFVTVVYDKDIFLKSVYGKYLGDTGNTPAPWIINWKGVIDQNYSAAEYLNAEVVRVGGEDIVRLTALKTTHALSGDVVYLAYMVNDQSMICKRDNNGNPVIIGGELDMMPSSNQRSEWMFLPVTVANSDPVQYAETKTINVDNFFNTDNLEDVQDPNFPDDPSKRIKKSVVPYRVMVRADDEFLRGVSAYKYDDNNQKDTVQTYMPLGVVNKGTNGTANAGGTGVTAGGIQNTGAYYQRDTGVYSAAFHNNLFNDTTTPGNLYQNTPKFVGYEAPTVDKDGFVKNTSIAEQTFYYSNIDNKSHSKTAGAPLNNGVYNDGGTLKPNVADKNQHYPLINAVNDPDSDPIVLSLNEMKEAFRKGGKDFDVQYGYDKRYNSEIPECDPDNVYNKTGDPLDGYTISDYQSGSNFFFILSFNQLGTHTFTFYVADVPPKDSGNETTQAASFHPITLTFIFTNTDITNKTLTSYNATQGDDNVNKGLSYTTATIGSHADETLTDLNKINGVDQFTGANKVYNIPVSYELNATGTGETLNAKKEVILDLYSLVYASTDYNGILGGNATGVDPHIRFAFNQKHKSYATLARRTSTTDTETVIRKGANNENITQTYVRAINSSVRIEGNGQNYVQVVGGYAIAGSSSTQIDGRNVAYYQGLDKHIDDFALARTITKEDKTTTADDDSGYHLRGLVLRGIQRTNTPIKLTLLLQVNGGTDDYTDIDGDGEFDPNYDYIEFPIYINVLNAQISDNSTVDTYNAMTPIFNKDSTFGGSYPTRAVRLENITSSTTRATVGLNSGTGSTVSFSLKDADLSDSAMIDFSSIGINSEFDNTLGFNYSTASNQSVFHSGGAGGSLLTGKNIEKNIPYNNRKYTSDAYSSATKNFLDYFDVESPSGNDALGFPLDSSSIYIRPKKKTSDLAFLSHKAEFTGNVNTNDTKWRHNNGYFPLFFMIYDTFEGSMDKLFSGMSATERATVLHTGVLNGVDISHKFSRTVVCIYVYISNSNPVAKNPVIDRTISTVDSSFSLKLTDIINDKDIKRVDNNGAVATSGEYFNMAAIDANDDKISIIEGQNSSGTAVAYFNDLASAGTPQEADLKRLLWVDIGYYTSKQFQAPLSAADYYKNSVTYNSTEYKINSQTITVSLQNPIKPTPYIVDFEEGNDPNESRIKEFSLRIYDLNGEDINNKDKAIYATVRFRVYIQNTAPTQINLGSDASSNKIELNVGDSLSFSLVKGSSGQIETFDTYTSYALSGVNAPSGFNRGVITVAQDRETKAVNAAYNASGINTLTLYDYTKDKRYVLTDPTPAQVIENDKLKSQFTGKYGVYTDLELGSERGIFSVIYSTDMYFVDVRDRGVAFRSEYANYLDIQSPSGNITDFTITAVKAVSSLMLRIKVSDNDNENSVTECVYEIKIVSRPPALIKKNDSSFVSDNLIGIMNGQSTTIALDTYCYDPDGLNRDTLTVCAAPLSASIGNKLQTVFTNNLSGFGAAGESEFGYFKGNADFVIKYSESLLSSSSTIYNYDNQNENQWLTIGVSTDRRSLIVNANRSSNVNLTDPVIEILLYVVDTSYNAVFLKLRILIVSDGIAGINSPTSVNTITLTKASASNPYTQINLDSFVGKKTNTAVMEADYNDPTAEYGIVITERVNMLANASATGTCTIAEYNSGDVPIKYATYPNNFLGTDLNNRTSEFTKFQNYFVFAQGTGIQRGKVINIMSLSRTAGFQVTMHVTKSLLTIAASDPTRVDKSLIDSVDVKINFVVPNSKAQYNVDAYGLVSSYNEESKVAGGVGDVINVNLYGRDADESVERNEDGTLRYPLGTKYAMVDADGDALMFKDPKVYTVKDDNVSGEFKSSFSIDLIRNESKNEAYLRITILKKLSAAFYGDSSMRSYATRNVEFELWDETGEKAEILILSLTIRNTAPTILQDVNNFSVYNNEFVKSIYNGDPTDKVYLSTIVRDPDIMKNRTTGEFYENFHVDEPGITSAPTFYDAFTEEGYKVYDFNDSGELIAVIKAYLQTSDDINDDGGFYFTILGKSNRRGAKNTISFTLKDDAGAEAFNMVPDPENESVLIRNNVITFNIEVGNTAPTAAESTKAKFAILANKAQSVEFAVFYNKADHDAYYNTRGGLGYNEDRYEEGGAGDIKFTPLFADVNTSDTFEYRSLASDIIIDSSKTPILSIYANSEVIKKSGFIISTSTKLRGVQKLKLVVYDIAHIKQSGGTYVTSREGSLSTTIDIEVTVAEDEALLSKNVISIYDKKNKLVTIDDIYGPGYSDVFALNKTSFKKLTVYDGSFEDPVALADCFKVVDGANGQMLQGIAEGYGKASVELSIGGVISKTIEFQVAVLRNNPPKARNGGRVILRRRDMTFENVDKSGIGIVVKGADDLFDDNEINEITQEVLSRDVITLISAKSANEAIVSVSVNTEKNSIEFKCKASGETTIEVVLTDAVGEYRYTLTYRNDDLPALSILSAIIAGIVENPRNYIIGAGIVVFFIALIVFVSITKRRKERLRAESELMLGNEMELEEDMLKLAAAGPDNSMMQLGQAQQAYNSMQLGYGQSQPMYNSMQLGYGQSQPMYNSMQLGYGQMQPMNQNVQLGYGQSQPMMNQNMQLDYGQSYQQPPSQALQLGVGSSFLSNEQINKDFGNFGSQNNEFTSMFSGNPNNNNNGYNNGYNNNGYNNNNNNGY